MSAKSQKEAFLNYEGDNYYLRNKQVEYQVEKDMVVKVLTDYQYRPSSILEIGCNTGYRLYAISQMFPGSEVFGIEPSKQAITQGEAQYPGVKFVHGTADEMQQFSSGKFDLVIIGFVLYVIDREILLKVLAETDRVLKNGGILMIIDFFAELPSQNKYEHIKELPAFAYKQNYDEVFTATKLYHLIDKRSMSHSVKSHDLSNDYYNKYMIATLKKDLTAGYRK
jgi:ubiquinone/menaquinone biosynthesis C-methylase UbiE